MTAKRSLETWREALREAVKRAKERSGMTQDAMADDIGVSRVVLSRAISSGSGIGWGPIVGIANIAGLEGAARVNFLFAFLETKTEKSDEGYAYMKMARELARRVPEEDLLLLRTKVVQTYEEVTAEKEAEKAARKARNEERRRQA